ncbi:hypothetical protein PFAG_01607 [Plasmodium falciparum Santa Lucia]|uniref:Mediator of RNA polymerase II transcription subunit 10, putative n=14 Tax=Plasmodium falciparum TaxID=5833 RepID=Q8IC13_PLAF7|nr:mediator of RNA polymerase II transcription subunit 10, putative [Plasmodium falciparum 3D7]ETW19473.1 hypothetical protein PFFVO_01654 [Plasmodium falciparum Vietnam Oak-Knoll (FVO)]ETW31469.1 hypothetical protein PFFCH_01067 [Plasmodium falciparum FCH/4]ETW37551.1 hypothetical protein PFTANZ_01737 [Plasmodium falciparum Tanzania (2000708)]ETW43846.1 hypothetical protein PFNF135_01780 [Plasmodium falciparum NF135/5.C10]ETW50266.1 hypothetical protein PFMALIP_01688 [Plasmodium falciparum Ma|eukprot:XP_001348990.1 conserved Plasmodium protein, unknown function [Plasmodium falciparum 3D7]
MKKSGKGRIKLKIQINTEEEENKENIIYENKNKKRKGSDISDDNDESIEKFKDLDNSYASDRKQKEDNDLEKKIISIISQLTKITCICEDKKNNINNLENEKICKKLIKQMYKYEKYLLQFSNYINENNNHNLDDITFPNGLIKAVDNYINPNVWIYQYLLLETKKQNDSYRNLIQNISTFDSTLKHKILNNDSNHLVNPVYPPLDENLLNSLNNTQQNYYKNVHIPKELSHYYLKSRNKTKED